MPATGAGRRRHRIGVAVLAILLATAGAWFFLLRSPGEARKSPIPAVLRYAEGDLLYTFHVPTGSEELFDVRVDPAQLDNLAGQRREEVARLRRLLTGKLGVRDLEDLRKGPLIDALDGLGYLKK